MTSYVQGIDSVAAGVTTYTAIDGLVTGSTTQANVKTVISAPGTFKNLFVRAATGPGAGETITVTLMVNGSAAALTAAISDGGTDAEGSDLVNEVAVVAGDWVAWRYVGSNNGSYTTRSPQAVAEFVATTQDECNLSGGIAGGADTWDTTTTYNSVVGTSVKNATESNRRMVIPVAGTIKNLYVQINTAPSAGDTRTFKLFKNGVVTTLVATVSETGTTANDTSNSVAVAAGDTVSIEVSASAGATNSKGGFGMTFLSGTPNVFLRMASASANPSTSVANYIRPCTTNYTGVWGSSFTAMPSGLRAELVSLYVALVTAPGAGTSYAFAVRQLNDGSASGNDVETDCVVTVADTDTTGNFTTSGQKLNWQDGFCYSCTPAGTPGAPGGTAISTAHRYIASGNRSANRGFF